MFQRHAKGKSFSGAESNSDLLPETQAVSQQDYTRFITLSSVSVFNFKHFISQNNIVGMLPIDQSIARKSNLNCTDLLNKKK